MPTITYAIYIDAPIHLCFDLARNVEVHMETTIKTNEKAIGGVTSGLLENGDTVTWEATHFGVKQQLTAKIIEMNRPYQFTDVMVKGAFHSFTHQHSFSVCGTGTMMEDIFCYTSPFGLLGKLADTLFLEKYMRNFIIHRANELKRIAEED